MREHRKFYITCGALLFAHIALNSPALAQNQSATLQLNQANQLVQLETKEFETIYRTDQVPDTCYRDEVQGYRTECRTEYDNVCHTRYERECRYVYEPVCHQVPRNSCHPVNDCRTEYDNVCNSHGCTRVPRRVCQTRNQCNTRYETVCNNHSRYVCNDVPRQQCTNVPRQVCNQVPNVVKVPYACTRPVQVPVGQQLKLHTVAKLNVNFANFGEVGTPADLFVATLRGSSVDLKLQSGSQTQYLYQIVSQQRTEQMVSATEKVITQTLSIRAVSIAQLNSFGAVQILNPKVSKSKIEFSTLGALAVPFKGHLKIVRMKNSRKGSTLVDDDFRSASVVGQGNLFTIALSQFGITQLDYKLHKVELNLQLDLSQMTTSGLINPESLALVNAQGPKTAFEGYP